MSDDAEVLEMLLPLSLLEQPSLDLYPLAQPYSVAGARSPTGLRSLGPELRVLPFDDGETDFARLELPGDTTVTLSDMSVHWLRASCSGACVATYSTLQEERSATESYPASLRVLRTAALGGLPANADCEAHVGGDISCQQKK